MRRVRAVAAALSAAFGAVVVLATASVAHADGWGARDLRREPPPPPITVQRAPTIEEAETANAARRAVVQILDDVRTVEAMAATIDTGSPGDRSMAVDPQGQAAVRRLERLALPDAGKAVVPDLQPGARSLPSRVRTRDDLRRLAADSRQSAGRIKTAADSVLTVRTVQVAAPRPRDPFTVLNELGFALRHSSDPQDNNPATISYVRDFEADEDAFHVEAGFRWTAPQGFLRTRHGRWEFRGFAGLEVSLTSAEDRDGRFWAARAGSRVVFDASPVPGQPDVDVNSVLLVNEFAVRYERSQDGDTKKVAAEWAFQPTVGRLGLWFRRAVGSPCSVLSWQLEPKTLVQYGHTIDVGDSEETEEEILRLWPEIGGTVYFDALGRAIGLTDDKAFPRLHFEWKGAWLPLETDEWHDSRVIGFVLPLRADGHLTIGATYTDVEMPPTFIRTHTFEIVFGAMF